MKYLQNRGLIGLHTDASWPGFYGSMPAEPTNAVAIYDTTPVVHGRVMKTGELVQAHGVQIKVRGADYLTGYQKIAAIKTLLLEDTKLKSIAFASKTFWLLAFKQSLDIVKLYKEEAAIAEVFTYNGTLSLNEE